MITPLNVSLKELSDDNIEQVCQLSNTLTDTQRRFVADNAEAIASAHNNNFSWIRVVYLKDSIAGLMELYDRPEIPEYLLWRFMIGGAYQGTGVGRQAIALLTEYVRSRPGATELVTSYIPGDGNPGGFYKRLGFTPNGKFYNGEIGLSLGL